MKQFRVFVYTNGTPRTSFPTGMRSYLSLPLRGKVADAGALARYDRFIGHRGRRMRCGPAKNFRLLHLVTILQNTSSTISSKWSPFPLRGRLKYRVFIPAFYKAIPRFCFRRERVGFPETNEREFWGFQAIPRPTGKAQIPRFHSCVL